MNEFKNMISNVTNTLMVTTDSMLTELAQLNNAISICNEVKTMTLFKQSTVASVKQAADLYKSAMTLYNDISEPHIIGIVIEALIGIETYVSLSVFAWKQDHVSIVEFFSYIIFKLYIIFMYLIRDIHPKLDIVVNRI